MLKRKQGDITMGKTKKIFTNFRVILALVIVLLAIISIHPNFLADGVAIRNVATNSSAALAGINSPKPTASPMSRERIISINNQLIEDLEDYYDFENELKANRTVHVKTNKGLYKLTTKHKIETTILNETKLQKITEEVFDEELNKTVNKTKTILVNKTESRIVGVEGLGLGVYDAPVTNIRKGLDLQGGTRVLLQPEEELTRDEMGLLVENMKYRLNIFGLSDVIVREAGDLSGNQYVLVEIAGAKEEEVKELLAKQGKFEALIGNETVFKGGEDITYVCRSADCSGIDPVYGCGATSENQWVCRFRFSISLSPEAAKQQAELTKDLEVLTDEGGDGYLSAKLELYLDNAKVDELNIGEDLKGRAVTDIQISGSGAGATQQEAVSNSLINMKRLQTILITGSLPVKLDIVKTDAISPAFGEEFIKNALFIGMLAIISVAVVVFIRYRRLAISLPMLCTSVIEVILILGFASIVGWNLDLAAIAGIIIAVGTGIDHQIIITDEILKGDKTSDIFDWKKRVKNAFFIIMAAYLTTLVAMLPLWFAGAGLLKGFALTTIVGVSMGVFIARPAYAAVIEILLKQ
ncbi:MMPL family transporter [Candidatus Woesearchaeota archaeon]|nr:MMPL family transporter [Candidatus Woesearchaeota archaeon]